MEREQRLHRGAHHAAPLILTLTAAVVIGLGASCASHQTPGPGPMPSAVPSGWFDPQPTSSSRDICVAACTRLRDHKCSEGNPTPNGTPCEDRCHTYESGHLVSFHPACVARVRADLPDDQACQAAKACETQP